MITEDYVSFKVAKLLKEKGFDEYGMYFYTLKDEGREGYKSNRKLGEFAHNSCLDLKERAVSCPTLQMAMKWLREVHNIDINIYAESISHEKRYTVSIWKNIQEDDAINDVIVGAYTIYEEAYEAAIKCCLEVLIRI